MSSFKPSSHCGTLHKFSSRLVAFEHLRDNDSENKSNWSTKDDINVLLWIGGLGDGLLTVPYVPKLAQHLPTGWTLAQIFLSSSYNGWGVSSLQKDAREISRCVAYFRTIRPNGKIVLMGHSTGCQDIMEFLTGSKNEAISTQPSSLSSATPVIWPNIDGAILQAPVSDREDLVRDLSPAKYESSVKLAQDWMDQGRGDDILPASATDNYYGAPVSARRWLSLASPTKDGDDDHFSSDLNDDQLQQSFGAIPSKSCPLLILYSEEDEHVPEHVDKEKLVKKWTRIAKQAGVVVDEENGGILPKAHHSFKQDTAEVVNDMIGRVGRFVSSVDKEEL